MCSEAAAAAAEQAAADAAAKGADLENPDVKASMSLESDDNSQEPSKFQKVSASRTKAKGCGFRSGWPKYLSECRLLLQLRKSLRTGRTAPTPCRAL